MNVARLVVFQNALPVATGRFERKQGEALLNAHPPAVKGDNKIIEVGGHYTQKSFLGLRVTWDEQQGMNMVMKREDRRADGKVGSVFDRDLIRLANAKATDALTGLKVVKQAYLDCEIVNWYMRVWLDRDFSLVKQFVFEHGIVPEGEDNCPVGSLSCTDQRVDEFNKQYCAANPAETFVWVMLCDLFVADTLTRLQGQVTSANNLLRPRSVNILRAFLLG